MKKILIILLLLLPILGESQFSDQQQMILEDVEYPKYYVKNDTQFVMFTYEQAQMVDNKLEILEKLEEVVSNYREGQDMYIYLVDKYERKILKKEKIISELEGVSLEKDEVIERLKIVVENYEEVIKGLEKKKDNLEIIIEGKDDEITRLKRQRVIIIGGAIIGIVVAILAGN